MKMSMKNIAEEYFSEMNSIATRMCVDMNETKMAYEDLWDTLSEEERKEILSESIIKPEISMKYPSKDKNKTQEYALRVVIDDHCSYRDEHSGPFSFKTKSQRDLSLFEKQEKKTKTTTKPKISLPNSNTLLENLNTFKAINANSSNSLPKTGLDFLDNW